MENSPSRRRCCDKEISHKMRADNYEQFKTLCRMHLSFELDLNTDEFDLPCHEVIYLDEKGKLKKWNRLSKKMRSCTSAVKNSPSEQNHLHLTMDFINQLRQLKQFLLKEENLSQEGIFRRTGAVSRQNELRSLINNYKELNLNENYTVHDCAAVFKSYLAELAEPLLTDAHYPAHCQISELCNGLSKDDILDNKKDEHILNSVQLLLLLLPEENRILLEDIIDMLNRVSKLEKSNKMSPDTLATLFSPHLICPRNLPPEALHYVSQTMSNVISFMISKGLEIFEIPSKLAIDIRAYYHEIKRKKTMSPEKTLDESISDISTVNTVYTFVDREKTAAASAHNINPTDTALAQLYAHIQSMPESSKKRKLIKQFNKENGQGTPQLLMVNRVKNSETIRSAKSISDSIKKHIFHKGIISRTPKRNNAAANFSTPNGVLKTPKLRVLFQSPVSTNNKEQLNAALGTPSSSKTSNISTLKSHPLQKSISSSSLITVKTININTNISESINETEKNQKTTSNSAPVSRVTSGDLTNFVTNSIENLGTPTNLTKINLSDIASKLLSNSNEKKIISWHDNISEGCSEDNSISIKKQNTNDLKSKYKSEPNLSRLNTNCDNEDDNDDDDNFTPIKIIGNEKSLTSKLIKGVSMGNLRLPFTTPESTKTFKRAASLLIRKISSNSVDSFNEDTMDCMPLYSEDLISNDKNNDKDKIDKNLDTQNLNIYHRNIDLITSTPSNFLGRRSMSPITKSTQRMPKSMQESIMTPRSRKPVMLMATTMGSSEQNQTIYQSDLSNFNEHDEDSFVENDNSNKGNDIYIGENKDNNIKKQIIKNNIESNSGKNEEYMTLNSLPDSLTNTFREYLLSRSVLTASPVDSSFSSRPDDFGGSMLDMHDINESQMSSSLLYCLDGNQPNENENKIDSFSSTSSSSSNQKTSSSISLLNCDNNDVPLTTISSNSRRKRSASYETTQNDNINDENDENNFNYQNNISKTKKLLIIKENPGETSL